jgi:DNA polymerase III sliding clamp (beta) subunit (PCNA family)
LSGIRIDRKRLLAAVATVAPAASRGYGVPALGGMLFSKNGAGALRLEATDMERRIETTIYTEAGEPFEVLASAQAVVESLKAQSDTFVDVGPLGPGLRVGAVTVPELKLEDWPKQPPGGAQIGRCRAPSFLTAIARAALAVSKDTYRPTLNSLAVTHDDAGAMRLVATDSFMLLAIDVPHAQLRTADGDPLLLPADTVKLLVKILKGEEGPITLGLSKEAPTENTSAWTWLWFRHAKWTLVTRLVDGQFPNWGQLVPEPEQGAPFDVSIAELREIVDAARKIKAERLEFRMNGEIEVSATGSLTRLERKLTGTCDGEVHEFCVNPALLHKALTAVPDPSIRIQDGLKPIMFRGKGALGLVMPIRMPVPVPDEVVVHQGEEPDDDAEEVPAPEGYVQDGPYLRPSADVAVPIGDVPGIDEEPDDDDLYYIGSHAFRELGWDPDLQADGYECCTCEEVVPFTGVDGTTGDPHRCWMEPVGAGTNEEVGE